MATLDELSTALRNADAAGDADAARALAAEISKMQPTAKPEVNTAYDIARSVPSGVAKGGIGLAGMLGDIPDLLAQGTLWGLTKLGIGNEEDSKKALADWRRITKEDRNFPTSQEVRSAVESKTGPLYEPQTTAGKYASTVGEFAPGLAMGPGGLLRRGVMNVALPAAGSETAGQIAEAKDATPTQQAFARVAGALLAGPTAAGVGRVFTPAPSSPARQRLVNILENEGVTSLTAGQRTGNEALRTAESTLGNAPFTGQAASRMNRAGEEQLTEAVMRRAGSGPDALPETLSQNQQRLGQQFEDLSARNTLHMDQQFAGDIQQVIRDYARVLPSEQRERIYNIITDLAQHGNAIPGEVYQATRSRLSRSAHNNTAADPDYADALRGLRNALDNAMGRSIAATGTPADQALWEATRREYGAQKTVEKTMSGASEAAGEGRIPPQALRSTVAAEDRGAYARGEGNMSELARAASAIMKPVPDSGTARRSALYHISNWPTAGILPALAGRALMSGPVQGYLSNQALAPVLNNMSPRQSAIVGALLAAQQPTPEFKIGPR